MQDSTLKIAIIRLSSLGDIISTLVFLDFLRKKCKKNGIAWEITWIVDSQFCDILKDSPLIDRIIDLPLRASKKNKTLFFSIIKKVRNLGYFDMVIDTQGLLKSAIIGKFLKKEAFIGYDRNSIREKIASFFYTKTAKIAYNEHILKRQYELFRVAFGGLKKDFDIKMLDCRNLGIGYSDEARVAINRMLPKKAPKILFIIEASKANKELPLNAFYAIAQGIWSDFEKANILLIWDKKESEIRALAANDLRFFVLPKLNFDEIKALLDNVDLVIGGDTGITHMAWAMKIPSITFYISTNMARFRLDGEKHISLQISSLQASEVQGLDSSLRTSASLKNDKILDNGSTAFADSIDLQTIKIICQSAKVLL